jgi:hypothetical protein
MAGLGIGNALRANRAVSNPLKLWALEIDRDHGLALVLILPHAGVSRATVPASRRFADAPRRGAHRIRSSVDSV